LPARRIAIFGGLCYHDARRQSVDGTRREPGMVEFLTQLINDYGYYALFLGTFAEGETILVLAGIAAAAGHLKLHWVMVLAFIGSLLGDQTVFFIGRRWGNSFLAKRPRLKPRVDKIHRMMERHLVWLIIGFRFLYGLRNIIPLVIATSPIPFGRFLILNTIGAALWAVVVSLLGYLFGIVVEEYLGVAKVGGLVGVAVLAVALWVARHLYLRYKARKALEESTTPDEPEKM
jgi:membrane protein DedA with SNARE-associated domain